MRKIKYSGQLFLFQRCLIWPNYCGISMAWKIYKIKDKFFGKFSIKGSPSVSHPLSSTDTSEDSKLVHRQKRPKVDTLFSPLFSDASERRVWLSAESKIRVHFWTFSPLSVNAPVQHKGATPFQHPKSLSSTSKTPSGQLTSQLDTNNS